MNVNEIEELDIDLIENIKTAFYRLWKLKSVVIIMTAIGFLSFFVYLGLVGVKTSYNSSATIYSAVYGSYEASNSGATVMNNYASLLSSTRVSERAAASLQQYGISAGTLRSMVNSNRIYLSGVSAGSKASSYKLILVVKSPSPVYAADVANAMAKAFADEINDLIGASTLQVMDEATGYVAVKSMNVPLYFMGFGCFAFVMTCMVIFLIEFFSPKAYSIAQCEKDTDQILGMIPYQK